MKVINLFGGPSAGKSATAYGLCNYMKINGYSVELITEFAKDLVWSERQQCLKNQVKVTAEQYDRQWNKNGKLDFIITDSPLLLGIIYCPEDYFKSFKPMVWELFNSFDNINIFLERTTKYVQAGRNENEEESNAISYEIQDLLRDNDCKYKNYKADKNVVQAIVNDLKYNNVI